MGAWSFQSEYMKTELNRMAGAPNAEYDGYYAFVSWIPFGGQRTYSMDSGEWGAVNPTGKRGALELALRASNVNLTDLDAGVEGGEADNITFGINWYANDHVRMMFNYIKQDNDEFADGDGDFLPDDDLDIYAVRFQLTF
jgi:phosphate-selective porin OprO/OprP